jgi:hypothetical protein
VVRKSPSRFTYTRIYCTPDHETHFADVKVELVETDFAPPAAPVGIGGQLPASSTFFLGAEAHWGAHDLDRRLTHPAPAAQLVIILQGICSITTTDGETRQFRPGDVLRVEDTAPCKGHITVNEADTSGFLLIVR